MRLDFTFIDRAGHSKLVQAAAGSNSVGAGLALLSDALLKAALIAAFAYAPSVMTNALEELLKSKDES